MPAMKNIDTTSHRSFFEPLLQTASLQAATMVLKPGKSSSDQPENEHPKAEQWLFVISGAGKAKVGSQSTTLKTGSLLLIEKGEPHQITNDGNEPLVTLNFYAPPAYTPKGNVKASVE